MNTQERRYDIDWLRVIAIALLLIYHIAVVFQPWGSLIRFIQNSDFLQDLWIPMSLLNVWRIPLLFFVSGMGVCFAMKKRNVKQLIMERSKRILLPFLFGMVAIVPLHIFLWLKFYNQDIQYIISRGHLWFLGNIFAYVVLFAQLFNYLKQKPQIQSVIHKIFNNPLSLLLVMIPFILEAVLVNPEIFTMYAMNWHGFFLGLVAFLFGYLFVYSGSAFWKTVLHWRLVTLALSAGLFLVRYFVYDLESPDYLMAVESNLWIYTVLGFGYKYLNRPSRALSYLTRAAYPVYIIHMVFLYLASAYIVPLEISASLKLILIIALTFTGCYAAYELLIRRIPLAGLLLGLNTKPSSKKDDEMNEPSLMPLPVTNDSAEKPLK